MEQKEIIETIENFINVYKQFKEFNTIENIIETCKNIKNSINPSQELKEKNLTLIKAFNFKKIQYPCEILTYSMITHLTSTPIVYILIDSNNGDIIYVGKTNSLLKRMKQHCLLNSCMGEPLTKRKIKLFYNNYFIFLYPFFCETTTTSDIIEQFLIEENKKTILNTQRKKWNKIEKYDLPYVK